VEPGGRPSEVADRDIRRERPVERIGEGLDREAARIGECDHLARGMHPGIGPPCAHDRLALSATQAGQRGLELSLDGPGIPL
jgi:hypothetical protein